MPANLIFYDTETSGIQKDFSQILQCGSIQTNRSFEELAQQNIGCRPLPWVNPQPKAMLTNKKIELFKSNTSHYQMMSDLHRQWREWTVDGPGTFVTYNGHAFDEELIRRQFYWNLLDIYLTNTNGNGRLDLFLMLQNLTCYFDNVIEISLHDGGPGISLKLEDLAAANNISNDDAHDAIADCRLMLELLKIIDGQIPEWIDFFISTATKPGMQAAINCKTFLALGEVYRRERFRYPVVICGADPTRPNEIVFFDLSFDPEEIFSLETSDIFSMVHKGGRDGPLKKYKINKTIPVCPQEMIEDNAIFDMDINVLIKRAELVRNNTDFHTLVSDAMADRIFNFKEPEHIEQLIYSGGFPKPSDKELMDDFHRIEESSYRIKIARNIEDKRFRLFAERLVCQMYPSEVPEDMQKRYENFLNQRLNEEGPWGSTEKILAEIEKLKDSEDQIILNATESFIKQRN